MDPDQIGTLIGLLGRSQPGASSAADLTNMFSKSDPVVPGANSKDPIIPTPQVDQSQGLFGGGSSDGSNDYGMLGSSPYVGMLS